MAQNQREKRDAAMRSVEESMRTTRGLEHEVFGIDVELDSLARQKQYLEERRATRRSGGVDEGIVQIDERIAELTGIRAEQSEALTKAQSERATSEARLDRVIKNIEDDAGNSDDAA